MSRRLLFTGPHFSALESRAFAELSDDVGSHPQSVLYVTPADHPTDATEERWREFGPTAALRTATVDRIVSEWYERDRYEGPVTNVDRPLLSRLVELGVERIADPENPLHTDGRFPRWGLVREARSLFTELEFAGLLSADEMRTRLVDEGLPARAAAVGELAEAIEAVRRETLADTLRETYRSERMHRVTTGDTPPDEAFPSVDAVVFGGFARFTVLEARLLERLAECWPAVAVLPMQTDADDPTGVDEGVAGAFETYRDLGFERRYHDDPDRASTAARRRVVRSLYRHPDRSPDCGGVDASELDLACVEPETVSEEVRTAARDVRRRLAAGTPPERIGVVLANPDEYADRVRETFAAYDLPFSLRTDVPLSETAVGGLVRALCDLSREPRTVDALLDVLTNPLVDADDEDGESDSFDHRRVARVAARVETNRLESTLDRADDDVRAEVAALLNAVTELAACPLDEVGETLSDLFDRLGVTAALDGQRALPPRLGARERRSREALDRVLETLAVTAPAADPAVGNGVDRLERALGDGSVSLNGRPTDGNVVVCDLAAAVPRDFDHVTVLGLVSGHFPSNPDQTAFTGPIYEAHPDFEQTDQRAEARSHFGSLLGSEASIRLSAPRRSEGGDPYVEADALTELGRVVDRSDIAVEPTGEPGCREDVQRAVGRTLADAGEDRARALVERAVAEGTFDADRRSRIEAGVACAAARASPDLTPYDGQLTAETVERVHERGEREPYSPSRLETYAACGFRYYARRVLELDAPDPLTREPDAGVRGSYVHDVLEHYYRSLQSAEGEPVEPGGDFEARRDRLLAVALDRLEDAFAEYAETAFHREWLVSVLAGLGTPAENPYYAPAGTDADGTPRGLLSRFLEHEFDEPAKATARPTWFEGRVGNPHDAGTPLSDDPARVETPEGTVPIHGLVDRIETVPGTAPTQAVVRDYKTGNSVPSEADALSGLAFQLPLYALLVESAVDDAEVVGGAYYRVSPPNTVNSRSGLLTSQEMAAYYGSDDADTPLLRRTYPHFETHGEFRRFLEETTPRRLGALAGGVSEGRYHPTVLDPSDAGCRVCDYAHVCDVRSHRRREVIESIDADDVSAYVPPKARNLSLEDAAGVE